MAVRRKARRSRPRKTFTISAIEGGAAISLLGSTGAATAAQEALAGNIKGALRGTGVGGKEGFKLAMADLIPGGDSATEIGAEDLWGGKVMELPEIADTSNLFSSVLDKSARLERPSMNWSDPDVDPPIPFVNQQSDDQSWIPGFAQGGQVPQMDQNTLIGLALLAEMGKQEKAYDNTPLEEKQPTIAEVFESQGKTLGGNDTQSIAQKLGR